MTNCIYTTYALIHVFPDLVILHFGSLLILWLTMCIYNLCAYPCISWFGYSSLWQSFNFVTDCVYTTYVLIHVFPDSVILHFGSLLISWLTVYIQLTCLSMYFPIWLFFTLAVFWFCDWLYVYNQLTCLSLYFLIWLFFTSGSLLILWLTVYCIYNLCTYPCIPWFGYSSLWQPFNFMINCVYMAHGAYNRLGFTCKWKYGT